MRGADAVRTNDTSRIDVNPQPLSLTIEIFLNGS